MIDQTMKNREESLRELNQSSFEAKQIFLNFAGRKRVHTDSLIMIRSYYNTFIKKGIPLKLSKFADVFFQLEKLGYGLTERYPSGELKAFMPDMNIKYIGMMAQPILRPVQPVVERPGTIRNGDAIVVLEFDTNGRLKKAEVPSHLVKPFNELINKNS